MFVDILWVYFRVEKILGQGAILGLALSSVTGGIGVGRALAVA